MLICPQCEFENPDTNKFCQSCGTPLQPNCDLQQNSHSTFKIATNHHAEVNPQTHFWAIITKLQPLKLENNSKKQLVTTNNNSNLQIGIQDSNELLDRSIRNIIVVRRSNHLALILILSMIPSGIYILLVRDKWKKKFLGKDIEGDIQ